MTTEQTRFSTLRVSANDRRGELVLDHPGHANALGAQTLRDLEAAARWFDARLDVHVVVVRGTGRFFCPGADIKDLPVAGALPSTGEAWHRRREHGQLGRRALDAVESMRAITIASVHGAAVGGGLLLMLACDFRVVARDAKLSLPEVDLGVPLAWGGTPRLVREVGPARARDLIMTCRRFSAEEAFGWGMINRLADPDGLEAETERLATDLLSKPSVPLLIAKDMVAAAADELASSRRNNIDGDMLVGLALDPATQEAAFATIARRAAAKEKG